MIIYKTTNLINGKIYIGKDTRNNPRYLGSGLLLQKAIKKYGFKSFSKEVIQECLSKEKLNECEEHWINFYHARNRQIGYNIALGGQGGFLDHLPKDFKERCARGHLKNSYRRLEIINKFKKTLAKKTRKEREETFLKRSVAKKGQVPWNKGLKIENPRKGFKLTEDHKKKLRNHKRTKKHCENISKAKRGSVAHNKKAILQLDNNGEILKEFSSVAEAAKSMKLCSTNFSKVCDKNDRTLGGYKWAYKE